MSREWKQVDRYPSQAARAALDRVADALSNTSWHSVLWTDQFEPTPYCRFSPEGQTLWDAWHGKLMRDIRGAPDTNQMLARVGKYPGLAARLMLVFSLVEWANGRQEVAKEVSATVVENVLMLINRYIIPMDLRVYGGFAITAEAEGGRRIAEWIVKANRPPSQVARFVGTSGQGYRIRKLSPLLWNGSLLTAGSRNTNPSREQSAAGLHPSTSLTLGWPSSNRWIRNE